MVLERIIEYKRLEVNERMARRPLSEIARSLEPSTRSLEEALRRPECGFILECKKASPSRGLIRPDFDPFVIAETYAPHADAISVLTDNRFFQGRLAYLRTVRGAVSQPVLCKDFIIDHYQIYEARRFGADAVLLMLSVLADDALAKCAETAAALGVDVLAEVHDKAELDRVLEHGLPIIGINNRNLKTLGVDLSVTEELAPHVPADRVVVSESGISTHRDVLRLRQLVDGFLVGSSLMAETNINEACRRLIYGPVKVCGLTRPADAEAAESAGAQYGGLIFADESPRRVDEQQAGTIRDAAALRWVGVFVNDDPQRIAGIVRTLGLEAVQLHGEESSDYIERLQPQLPERCEIWKAVRVGDRVPTNIEDTAATRILLDAYKPGLRGGTGEQFDWALVEGRDLSRIVLSGGLNPENAAWADTVGAFALDVNSGVEEGPGIKSATKLEKFFAALRGRGKDSGQNAK